MQGTKRKTSGRIGLALAALVLVSSELLAGGSRRSYGPSYGSSYGQRSGVVAGSLSRGFPAGRWKTVRQKVWVPARYSWQHFAPSWRLVHEPCGTVRRVLVDEGGWRSVLVEAGHYEVRLRRVWIPGRRRSYGRH